MSTIERVTAWQCIGCGRIEGPQPCIGVCQDRKTEFVYAADHEAIAAQLVLMRAREEVLVAVVRQLACMTPRRGQWEPTYRALQTNAQQVLKVLNSNRQPKVA